MSNQLDFSFFRSDRKGMFQSDLEHMSAAQLEKVKSILLNLLEIIDDIEKLSSYTSEAMESIYNKIMNKILLREEEDKEIKAFSAIVVCHLIELIEEMIQNKRM